MINRYSLNGGEVDHRAATRTDLVKYYNSCTELKNFFVNPVGSLIRKPGSQCLKVLDDQDSRESRAIPFSYSATDSYLIVISKDDGDSKFSAKIIDLSDNSISGTISDLPYAAGELSEITYLQSADVVWLAHESHPLKRIERYKNDAGSTSVYSWNFVDHNISGGPWLGTNTNRSKVMRFSPELYYSATHYVKGDTVAERGSLVSITGVANVEYINMQDVDKYDSSDGFADWGMDVRESPNYTWDRLKGIKGDLKKTRVTATNSLSKGDYVWCNWDSTSPDGVYEVLATNGSTWFEIYAGTYWDLEDLSYKHEITIGSAGYHKMNDTFYECIQDSYNLLPSTHTAYWRPTATFVGEVTIETADAAFNADWVGGHIRMDCDNVNNTKSATFYWTGQKSKGIPCIGTIVLKTSGGRWGGEIHLQESLDNGATWTTIGFVSSNDADYNGSIEREIEVPGTLIRVYMDTYTAASTYDTGCQWTLTFGSYTVPQIVKITEYVSEYKLVGRTVTPLYSISSTDNWAEGSFSPRNGFPSTAAIWNNRLVLAGSKRQPSTIWFSSTGDYENWYDGYNPDNAISLTLGSNDIQKIKWSLANKALIIGTSVAEWTVNEQDISKGFSADNYKIREQSRYGSANVQAVKAADSIFFVSHDNSKLYKMNYDYPSDSFQTEDMTLYAGHITQDYDIIALATSNSPFQQVHALLDNGEIYSLTYNIAQKVMGWSHLIDSYQYMNSMCIIPGPTLTKIYTTGHDGSNSRGYVDVTVNSIDLVSDVKFLVKAGRNSPALHLDASEEFKSSDQTIVCQTTEEVAKLDMVMDMTNDDMVCYIDGNKGVKDTDWFSGYVSVESLAASIHTAYINVCMSTPTSSFFLISKTGSTYTKLYENQDWTYSYAAGVGKIKIDTSVAYADCYYIFGWGYAITVEDDAGNTLIDGTDYDSDYSTHGLGVDSQSSDQICAGIPMTSSFITTNLYNLQEGLIPGSTFIQVAAPDIILANSTGGQMSADGGGTWQDIDMGRQDNLEETTINGITHYTGYSKQWGCPSHMTRQPKIGYRNESPFHTEVINVGADLTKGAR